jgi:hypothetical protein
VILQSLVGIRALSMPDDAGDSDRRGPIDAEILDRIAAHLIRSDRFNEIQTQPASVPNAVIADYTLGYFPAGSRAHVFGFADSKPTTSASTTPSSTRPGNRGNVDGTATRMITTPASTLIHHQMPRHPEKMPSVPTIGGTCSQPCSPISMIGSKPSGTSNNSRNRGPQRPTETGENGTTERLPR